MTNPGAFQLKLNPHSYTAILAKVYANHEMNWRATSDQTDITVIKNLTGISCHCDFTTALFIFDSEEDMVMFQLAFV